MSPSLTNETPSCSQVILGYELASEKCREELESASLPFSLRSAVSLSLTRTPTSSLGLKVLDLPLPPSQDTLSKAISPSIASKQPGNESFLSDLVAEASLAVMPKNPKDFSVDSVRVVKILGGSLSQSRVVRGMVFGREPDGERALLFGCHPRDTRD